MPTSDWSPIAAENTSITNNADLSTNISEQNPRPYSHNQAIQALMEGVANLSIDETYTAVMNWAGEWVQQAYKKSDVVLDNGWTMISLVDNNEERAGVTPNGSPEYIYTGTSPTTSDTAKQIVFGNRYTIEPANVGYLTGWRLYVIAANVYTVYSVRDPGGNETVNQLINFTATTTGWITFAISPLLLTDGAVFDMVAVCHEPDSTPTTFSSDWEYVKPNNPGTPLAGQALQANREIGLIKFSVLNDAGTDVGSALRQMTVGDTVQIADGTTWSIQTIEDHITYIQYGVAPAVQDPLSGVHTFTFNTQTATPITYVADPNWWTNSGLTGQGLLGVDVAYDDIVPDGNFYGIDIQVQRATVPTQWDVVAPAAGVVGGTDVGGVGASVADEAEVHSYYNLPLPYMGGLICVTDHPVRGVIMAYSDGTGWYEMRKRPNPL